MGEGIIDERTAAIVKRAGGCLTIFKRRSSIENGAGVFSDDL
jgi:hypothetical protein